MVQHHEVMEGSKTLMKQTNWTALALSLGLAGLGCSGSTTPTTDASVATDTPVGTDVPAADNGAPTDAVTADSPAATTCGTMLGGACDPVSGTGCAAGMGCYVRTPMGGASTGACEIPGRGEWGATCATNADCREGFACLLASAGGTARVCTRLCCEGDNAACRDESHGGMPGALCDRALTLNNTMIHVCQAPVRCDPHVLTGNGCPADRPYCNVISMDGTTTCIALGAHPGAEGALCCTDGCQAGFTCVGASGECDAAHPLRACRRVCDPTPGSDAGVACPAMQTCMGLVGRPNNFGACAPTM